MEPYISVVIPALDEEPCVARVVATVRAHPLVRDVIVVDNGSTDDTPKEAFRAGARVVFESRKGIGYALKVGIANAVTDTILRTDADITNWHSRWIDALCAADRGHLRRGVFQSPYDQFPVTRLVVRPYLELFVPALSQIQTPISGTYCFDRRDIFFSDLANDWAFDVSLLISAHERQMVMCDIDIGILCDRQRSIEHYEPMARQIHAYFLNKFTRPVAKD